MRTVRFNVQMSAEDIPPLRGLELRMNAHEMRIHEELHPERTLMFRSHTVISRQGNLAVVEMVLQRLDKTFPAHKRASQPVADLHLLLRDMTVPNVESPAKDEGQEDVLEEDVADEQPVNPQLLGKDDDVPIDANFDDDTEDEDEGEDDGPERDSAGDQNLGNDTSTIGKPD